jgi:hypothetical protein
MRPWRLALGLYSISRTSTWSLPSPQEPPLSAREWGKERSLMKNEVEDIPMALVWYVVAALVVIGILGVIVVVVAANYLQSTMVPIH